MPQNKSILSYLILFIVTGIVLASFFPLITAISRNAYLSYVYVLGFAFLIIRGLEGIKLRYEKKSLFLYLFLALWMCYSLFSYVWADDKQNVIDYTMFIGAYLIISIIISQFCNTIKRLKFIHFLFILISLAYIAVAIWEVSGFRHMFISRHVDNFTFIPTGPFYNENTLASAIILIFPFIIFGTRMITNVIVKFGLWLIAFLLLLIVVIQSARFAILIIGLDLFLYFIVFLNFKKKIQFLTMLLLLSAILMKTFPIEYDFLTNYMDNSLRSLTTEQVQYMPSSMKIRKELVSHYIDLGAETYLFGLGSGNFVNEMGKWRLLKTFGVRDAHNYVMEIFTGNGLLLSLVYTFVILYGMCKLLILSLDKNKNPIIRNYYFMGLFCLINYWGVNFLPGSLMIHTFHWIIFGFCLSLIMYEDSFAEVIDIIE